MEENEMLQAILQKERIGWWEADISRHTVRLSETLRTLFGFDTCDIDFERLGRTIEPLYRSLLAAESEIQGGIVPGRLRFPHATPEGEIWILSNIVKHETLGDGRTILSGYARKIPVCETPAFNAASAPGSTEGASIPAQKATASESVEQACRLAGIGYCRFDLRTNEGYASPQWSANMGEAPGTPPSETIGTCSHVKRSDRPHLADAIRRIREGAADSCKLDLRIVSDADEHWTRLVIMRNPHDDRRQSADAICLNYDISEFKATERRLIEAKNKAEVSDRLKSAFLANMSHEIRTPLNAIVGFSNLLTETDDPDEQRSYLNIVEENNNLLLSLISDILDLSKIEAGTFELNYEPVDIDRMCHELIQSLRLKIQGRPVELTFDDRSARCIISSDKTRLMQVISNFINNAIKFTEEGGITLRYRAENGRLLFSVEDTGSGIPADRVDTVFDRFVTLNNLVQGTGLGLPISKSIVEQMGGNIGVDSKEGEGSRFWFSIPARFCESSDMPAQSVHAPTYAAARTGGERPVLLVAEDTDSNFLLVSLMLRKEYEIIRAHDGEEAVRICAEKAPDAILMDLKMPVMDGLEATRTIRLTNPDIPIVAVSAFAYDQDRIHALEAGCNDYMTKPIAGDRLRPLLRSLLH